MSYYIRFNNRTNKELKFSIIKRPSIPCPVKKYNKITIDGSDGDYYEDTGTYEDIEISIPCNFVSYEFNKQWRNVKHWINNINDFNLILSDNKDYFFKVKTASIKENERLIKKIGKFTLVFVCDPYEYLQDGQEEIELTELLENDYSISKPIYRIKGNGECLLTVNGNTSTFKVAENINIDTESGLIFKDNGDYCFKDAQIKDFSNLYLFEGENICNWTNGFSITIIPNWRVI